MELATGWCIGDPKVDLRGLQVGDLRELRNGQNWPVVLPGQYTPQCRPSGTYMPIGIDRTRPGIGSAAIAKFQHETRLRLLLHAQPDVSVFEPMRRVRAYFGSLTCSNPSKHAHHSAHRDHTNTYQLAFRTCAPLGGTWAGGNTGGGRAAAAMAVTRFRPTCKKHPYI